MNTHEVLQRYLVMKSLQWGMTVSRASGTFFDYYAVPYNNLFQFFQNNWKFGDPDAVKGLGSSIQDNRLGWAVEAIDADDAIYVCCEMDFNGFYRIPKETKLPNVLEPALQQIATDEGQMARRVEALVKELGLTIDREAPDWKELTGLLEGCPLAMRAALPELQNSTPGALSKAIRSNLADYAAAKENEDSAMMSAVLNVVTNGLSPPMQSLLILLALHVRFVEKRLLKEMARHRGDSSATAAVDQLLATLVEISMLRDCGDLSYEIHPFLSRFLNATVWNRADDASRDAWCRAFVEVMARVAREDLTSMPPWHLFVQRVFADSFRNALAHSEHLGIDSAFADLCEFLGTLAGHGEDYPQATAWYARLAEHSESRGNQREQAEAYLHLGRITGTQGDLVASEQWSRRALAIFEDLNDEQRMADACHQLMVGAGEQDEFETALQWSEKSLALKRKLGDERGIAITYQGLGRVVRRQGDMVTAQQWCRESVAIFKRVGDKFFTGLSYVYLAEIATEEKDIAALEHYSREALAIFKKLKNSYYIALTYEFFTTVAYERGDFSAAEQWCRSALDIFQGLGNKAGIARVFHLLAKFAYEQDDFVTAKQYNRESIAIFEELGDQKNAVEPYRLRDALLADEGA